MALGIYKENRQNKDIKSKLDAWMVFLSSDEPEDIVSLITKYPEFKSMYEVAYELCLNTEKVMNMFSKELRMMDNNTVEYMIDIMQKEIDEQKAEIEAQKAESEAQKKEINTQRKEIDTQKAEIEAHKKELLDRDDRIQSLEKEIMMLKQKIKE